MMLGSILFPAGFFLVSLSGTLSHSAYSILICVTLISQAGWTSQPSTHWFPSVLGFSMIGTAFLLIFQAGLNYLIDSYSSRAASGESSSRCGG